MTTVPAINPVTIEHLRSRSTSLHPADNPKGNGLDAALLSYDPPVPPSETAKNYNTPQEWWRSSVSLRTLLNQEYSMIKKKVVRTCR